MDDELERIKQRRREEMRRQRMLKQLKEKQEKIDNIESIINQGNTALADTQKQLEEMAKQKAALEQQVNALQGAETSMP